MEIVWNKEVYISIGEFAGLAVDLFFLLEGMVGCKGGVHSGDGAIEDDKVVKEGFKHCLNRVWSEHTRDETT